jgi:hypothetical protein
MMLAGNSAEEVFFVLGSNTMVHKQHQMVALEMDTLLRHLATLGLKKLEKMILFQQNQKDSEKY